MRGKGEPMKISNLVYEPVQQLSELARRMEMVASLGYHGIELTATHPPGYSAADVAALSRKHALPVVSLLSGWSYGNEGLCLSSPDAAVRQRAVERLIDYLGYAAELGAVVVVGLMQGLRSDEPDETKAQERIADCLREAARAAEQRSVALVIEPVNHLQVGFNHTAGEVRTLIDHVGSPALRYMLDTIHMNIEERSVLDTIAKYGPRARHFHLCESNGAPYGTGNLDFPKVLAAIKDSGYEHYVSVKIYRKSPWEASARSAAEFLKRQGVQLRS